MTEGGIVGPLLVLFTRAVAIIMAVGGLWAGTPTATDFVLAGVVFALVGQ